MAQARDHLDAIMGVMAVAFAPEYGEAWNRRQIGDALVLPTTRYALIAPDGTIAAQGAALPGGAATAGFYLSRAVLDEEELLLFAIAPDWRRRGLGHVLLRNFIAQARSSGKKRCFLEMRRNNPAGFLYASHGFRPIGIRPRYYRTSKGDQIDAITQELIIG